MTTTIGFLGDVDVCAAIAGLWPSGPQGGPEAVFSPPTSVDEIARRASIVVSAVSEDQLPGALKALGLVAGPHLAVVSTSPTVSLKVLRSLVGEGPALLRAVIPLGTLPGEGVAALAPEPGTPEDTTGRVKEALAGIGSVDIVAEDALDAIAALTLGSASFLAEALQGMEEGAARDGLPRLTARAFAHQTALATALLLRRHSGSPADLKDQVASPGGTTIVALATLEDAGVRGAYIRAVQRTAVEVRRRRDAAAPSMIE
jgi:pyrroline-5-carboxylate reductase